MLSINRANLDRLSPAPPQGVVLSTDEIIRRAAQYELQQPPSPLEEWDEAQGCWVGQKQSDIARLGYATWWLEEKERREEEEWRRGGGEGEWREEKKRRVQEKKEARERDVREVGEGMIE